MKVTALELRNKLGSVLEKLDRTGEPIVVEKGRVPRAVLIPLSLFKERFLDYQQTKLREELLQEIMDDHTHPTKSTLQVLHELRYANVKPE